LVPRLRIPVSAVDLYRADLDELGACSTAGFELVTAAEIAQARSFSNALLRRRFLRGRALVREILAPYMDSAPSDLLVDRTCSLCGAQHGKPRLAGGAHPESELHFSVARSGSCCVIAVSAGPVGVDVEIRRDLECDAIAAKEFSESEADYIQALPAAVRAEAFLELWVRKEALAKAVGTGLNHDILTTNVLGRSARVRLADQGTWSVVNVNLGRPGVAAIAARSEIETVWLLEATA
jgi:phosphopantetheinyl transferase